jgi:esterase/lipase superfamily enzyme
MHREYKKWWSPSLGKEMELLVFGHAGTPVLVFPSSLGRFFEWEDFKMMEAMRHQIENGFNRFILVDSVDSESFYNKNVDPYVRIMRHRQYEAYIVHEVIPFIYTLGQNRYLVATGCSFGAYHAVNIGIKHPYQFKKIIAMGGMYDIKSFLHGFYDENVYFNNPIDYIRNIHDEHQLNAIRAMDIRLVTGVHDICWDANERFSNLLHTKSIPHQLDLWGDGTGHDWPFWREQMKKHII